MALGLDYGYTQVKALDLEKSGNDYSILKTGVQPIKIDGNSFDPDKISNTHWIAAIQELLSEMKLNPRRIKSSVS